MVKFPYKTFSEVLTLVVLCMLRDILEQERGKFLSNQLLSIFMHIGLGLSVRLSVCYTCTWSRTVRDRILKFGMWDVYKN